MAPPPPTSVFPPATHPANAPYPPPPAQTRPRIPVTPQPPSPESFDSIARREEALRVLESNEMLIWYSVARNESLPQTRLYFQRILAGMPVREPENVVSDEEDEPDKSERPEKSEKEKARREERGGGERERRREKGKRESSGAGPSREG